MASTINMGGVPEHFNLPWHLAIENGFFEKEGIDLVWHTCDGGTGEMCKMLSDGKLDMAVLLTEGAVKNTIEEKIFKIIQLFIETPLVWGIHTGNNSSITHYAETFNKPYAISRFGSGSHLMPQVDAHFQNQRMDAEQWQIVHNLEGAMSQFKKTPEMVFYWEKFTTKPLVDKGLLKRVGEFVTPWPCFVLVASNKVINETPALVKKVSKVINYTTEQLMEAPNAIDMFIERYKMLPADAHQWFYMTEWAKTSAVSVKMLQNVMQILQDCGVLKETVEVNDLLWQS